MLYKKQDDIISVMTLATCHVTYPASLAKFSLRSTPDICREVVVEEAPLLRVVGQKACDPVATSAKQANDENLMVTY